MTLPSVSRQQRVERVREAWIRRLIDLSRRNNLLYFRDLRTGTLDLSAAEPTAMQRLLAGEPVSSGELLPAGDPVLVPKALNDIRRRAQANLEEKGLDTLFLAMHMATWNVTDGGRPPAAAVTLVPVTIEPRGRLGQVFTLTRNGDLQVNLVLLYALEAAAGLQIDPVSLLGEEPEDATADSVAERLRAALADVPGFAITPRAAIGNFAFQKLAMVKDLREHAVVFEAHPLIGAIAGDDDSRAAILGRRTEIAAASLDARPPSADFLVLDSDSSQQLVVEHARGGQDGVIQGPPGTGKSQTIVNLIASMAAEGKRVLFVAEKRAALDVVLRRLQVNGLGHLALDLHGADISRREVMQRIANALVTVRESVPVPDEQVHEPFVDRRQRLNAHVKRLHRVVAPSNRTVFDLQGQALDTAPEHRATTRWRGADLDRLDEVAVRDVVGMLTEAAGFGPLFLGDSPSPWNRANLPDGATALEARDLAASLANVRWPNVVREHERARVAASLPAPATLGDLLAQAELMTGVATTLRAYRAELFAEDLQHMATNLWPGTRGWLPRTLAGMVNGGYKRARKTAGALRLSGADGSTLHAEITRAAEQKAQWQRLGGASSTPVGVDTAPIEQALGSFRDELSRLEPRLALGPFATKPIAEVSETLEALAADTITPERMPRVIALDAEVRARGAGAILDELAARDAEPETWGPIFAHAYVASCLDRARAEDPAIAGFNGRSHDTVVEQFCDYDRQRLKVAVGRVRRAHAERAIAVMNRFPEQDALVRREAQKKNRHLPLRRLLAQAPDVLTTLCPCWMASPLSVSQLLGADRRYFDVVVFDEASQVLPEDAACSLIRAEHAVVAGDSKQLPPTTFFAAGQDDGEVDEQAEMDATTGLESLLDLMAAFLPPWTLDWHYRSRDESLIAFSNHHIYDDRLVTFPGPGGPPRIGHELVPQSPGEGQEESATNEVRRVVELVLAHAEQRPKETLGVIAMGIKHAARVQDAIDDALAARPDLDAFFDQSKDERFFVKNLERVQGDERDAIIITVGYGKDARGKLPYRFGPLLQDGGERRLNVAITRARQRLTLVSSFAHHDMDPERSSARGVQLLREYLAYAAAGGQSRPEAASADGALNPFEHDVVEALTARGLKLAPHRGASRFPINFAVEHPADPARFVMAIECDGPRYAAMPTARDRDRTRQQQLQGLGWHYHRIWSPDWYMRRDGEIDRAVAAYEAALAASNGTPAATPSVAAAPTAEAEPEEHDPRGRRPRRRQSIDDYSLHELVNWVGWLNNDGRLRTDEEMIAELVPAMGWSRRGARIDAALRMAVQRWRMTQG